MRQAPHPGGPPADPAAGSGGAGTRPGETHSVSGIPHRVVAAQGRVRSWTFDTTGTTELVVPGNLNRVYLRVSTVSVLTVVLGVRPPQSADDGITLDYLPGRTLEWTYPTHFGLPGSEIWSLTVVPGIVLHILEVIYD